MKIKIVKHEQDEINHSIEIRYEQELEPFNSFNWDLAFNKEEWSHLSQNELYTLAYLTKKEDTIKRMKLVKWEEEELNPVDFEIVESKPHKITMDINSIAKEKNKDLPIGFMADIKDQYGFRLGGVQATLKEPVPGVIEKDAMLLITSDGINNIPLKAEHGGLTECFDVKVEVFELPLTEVDHLGKQVSELTMQNIVKDEQIKELGQQITNLIIGGGLNE